MQKIKTEDIKHHSVKEQKADLLRKHKQEVKESLIRKHEIAFAMETMRITNDFSMLDQLFASKKKNKKGSKAEEHEGEDPRLSHTA